MVRTHFPPTGIAAILVAALGLAALGFALWMRYAVVEVSTVGLACEAGLRSTLCLLRGGVIVLFNQSVFGGLAILAALVHLWRPHVAPFGVALAAGAIGVVLYNTGLAALALALLVVSFARPAPARV